MSDNIVYWSGHHCFGDSFCLCAAAAVKAKYSNKKIRVSFWENFSGLAKYFDGIEWVHENELFKYTVIDSGRDPFNPYASIKQKNGYYINNGVSRFLMYMNPPEEALPDIYMNIDRLPSIYTSVIVRGGVNGFISKDILRLMLMRAKKFYPSNEFIFIGHKNNEIQNYTDLQVEFNIKDARTDDITSDVVIGQIRQSSLVIGPHTGLIFPALGLGCNVWVEDSLDVTHNFCLDFPKNRPFYYSKRLLI